MQPEQTVALRKLVMLHSANAIDDLRTLPGNMLELLRGDRAGQYSIRNNRQWRICSTWQVDLNQYVGPNLMIK